MVEVFRSSRPTNALGVTHWDPVNRDDAATAYVLAEGLHHVTSSRDSSNPDTDEVMLGWLIDQPRDAIVEYAGEVLGEEVLTRAAEAAERSGEMWLAACRWAAAAQVVLRHRGQQECIVPFRRADDALTKVDMQGPHAFQRDLLALAVLDSLAVADWANIPSMVPRIEALLLTEAARAQPTVSYGLTMRSTYVVAMIWDGDTLRLARAAADAANFLLRVGCEGNPDPATQELCCVELCYVNTWCVELGILSPTWSWENFGPEGAHCRAGLEAYHYDSHHAKLISLVVADYAMMMLGCDLPLTLHWGATDVVLQALEEMTTKWVPRMNQESNQIAEGILPMFMPCVIWPLVLGKGKQMATVPTPSNGFSYAQFPGEISRLSFDSFFCIHTR